MRVLAPRQWFARDYIPCTDHSGSTVVPSARYQAPIAQCDQPGSDICSQGDYRAEVRDIKHFTYTGS